MKRLLAGLLTVATLAMLLWSGSRRPPAPAAPPADTAASDDPAEACVRRLLRSARLGDVAGYLACFTGDLRLRLEREASERGRDAFADDLRRASAARKSHALFAAEPDGGDSAARVTVETVYPDRNERQTYLVERNGSDWLVAAVETVKSHAPASKFGSPASYVAPEGVPVQGAPRVETGDPADPTAGEGDTP